MGTPGNYWKNEKPDGLCIKRESGNSFSSENEQGLYGFSENSLNFSTNVVEEDELGSHKRKIIRDPMSHRIIEKRRRDRMNNCLADLSRLIPADYLKKGRGRIEKTEIIEMAIKHMRYLQNGLSAARSSGEQQVNEEREEKEQERREPIVIEHYRLGYLECLSEAMHFLVEVQGFFAGDSLCIQMMNHLHKHCDKILKGDVLNYPRKQSETTSNSSASTTNGTYNANNSPPLGMSNSTTSNSDDQASSHMYLRREHYEKYVQDQQQQQQERNQQDYNNCCNSTVIQPAQHEPKREVDDRRHYLNIPRRYTETDSGHKNYSSSSGFVSSLEHKTSMEDENDSVSQLREMLITQANSHSQCSMNKSVADMKPMSPALSQTSGCETSSSNFLLSISEQNKTNQSENIEQYHDQQDHTISMYKFKNNIKQRFTKETDEFQIKKQKTNDLKFNICKSIYSNLNDNDITNRLGFGHKKKEVKKYPAVADCSEVAVFALHSSKSFYVPLTLQTSVLAPFFPVLGLIDFQNQVETKPVLHPVTISVNFQPIFSDDDSKRLWRNQNDSPLSSQ